MANVLKKSTTFGGCDLEHVSPDEVSETTRMIVVTLSFEEALKLSLAVDEGLRALNRYNRASAEGKAARLKLHIKPQDRRLFVQEGRAGKGGGL
jgi:hypothetical protein